MIKSKKGKNIGKKELQKEIKANNKNLNKKRIKEEKRRKKIIIKNNKKTLKKVRKIKYGRLIVVFLILFLVTYVLINLISFPIKNIFISNNYLLSDQEIIELANIEDYPSMFKYTENELEKKIEKNIYVKKATVKKKNLKEIYISVVENSPILYDTNKLKTILYDLKEVEETFDVPTLINYVPDTIYSNFIDCLKKVENDILVKISEIKYDPNSVDDERFVLSMDDGNYVYLTLSKFTKINSYIDVMKEIVKKYDDKNGILYLDDGEYFELLKN